MGNTDSTLGLANLQIDRSNCQVYNDWTMTSGELEGLPVTVFSASHPTSSMKRPYIERALQASRVYRHPGLLRFIAGGVVGGGAGEVVMVMEETTPLQHHQLQDMSPLQVTAGLASVIETLTFLHDTAGVSHNNLSTSSIFVTPDYTWKLWGLEYSCSFSELKHRHLAQIHSFCHSASLPPDDTARIGPAYQHARDVYAFANLVEELLRTCPAIGDVPGMAEFLGVLSRDARRQEWGDRPRLERLQEHSLFTHTFLQLHRDLTRLMLMEDQEREIFLSGLVSSLRQYPEVVVASSLSPALLSRPVLLVPRAAQAILPSFLTPQGSPPAMDVPFSECLPLVVEGLFTVEVFSEHIVPRLVELFLLHDLPVRLLLLHYLPCYISLVPQDVLAEDVLPQVLLGVQDRNEGMVCASLRALAVLVPVLGADRVVGGSRRAIFADTRPKASLPTAAEVSGRLAHTCPAPTNKASPPGLQLAVTPHVAAAAGNNWQEGLPVRGATVLVERSSPDGGEDEDPATPGGGKGVRGQESAETLASDADSQDGTKPSSNHVYEYGSVPPTRKHEDGTEAKSPLEKLKTKHEEKAVTGWSDGSLSGTEVDTTSLARSGRPTSFKHGHVGFSEIFAANDSHHEVFFDPVVNDDLIAKKCLLGTEFTDSKAKLEGDTIELNILKHSPLLSLHESGKMVTLRKLSSSDEVDDWSDWDDVNEVNGEEPDFSAALTILNSTHALTADDDDRVTICQNAKLDINDQALNMHIPVSHLETSETNFESNNKIKTTESEFKVSPKISEKSASRLSVATRHNISKGLGEEFDVLSIEVKKKPVVEIDFFADLAPNLKHKKFDLEQLLEEANSKVIATHILNESKDRQEPAVLPCTTSMTLTSASSAEGCTGEGHSSPPARLPSVSDTMALLGREEDTLDHCQGWEDDSEDDGLDEDRDGAFCVDNIPCGEGLHTQAVVSGDDLCNKEQVVNTLEDLSLPNDKTDTLPRDSDLLLQYRCEVGGDDLEEAATVETVESRVS